MNVSLTPELESFIADQVERGRYRSASEAVRAAVRLLQTEAEEREARLEALREAVGTGLEELDRGEGVDAAEVFEGLLKRLDGSEAA